MISEFQVLPDWNSQEELGLEGMAAPLTNSPSNQLHFVTDATYPLILLHHQQQFHFQKVAGKKNHLSWRYMVRSVGPNVGPIKMIAAYTCVRPLKLTRPFVHCNEILTIKVEFRKICDQL